MIRLAAALMLTIGLAAPAAAECTAPAGADRIGAEMTRMLNAERQRRGLPRLTYSPGLSRVASSHACDMVRRNYFSHVAPNGATPMRRVKAAGVCVRSTAENIAAGYRSPGQTFDVWMGSSGHFRNMMSNRVNSVGIGVVEPGPAGGGRRWVMVLARQC